MRLLLGFRDPLGLMAMGLDDAWPGELLANTLSARTREAIEPGYMTASSR